MNDLISIAMATYNGGKENGKYLRMQLDSILAQTVQDFEIVVCDDCSTDDTWRILEEFANKDKRFRLFENKENLGFVKNFERAASLCKGEYVAFADQDDIWEPTHLESLLKGIGEKSLVCGDMVLIDAEGKSLSEKPSSYLQCIDSLSEEDLGKAYTMIYFFGCFLGQSIMARKEFLNKALPIPNGIPYHDFWLSLASCFCGGMNFTYDVVTRYRRYTENHSWTPKQRPNRFRYFYVHLTGREVQPDRMVYLRAIEDRLSPLTEEQKEFMRRAEVYFNRTNKISGRCNNALFEWHHYKQIYRCKDCAFTGLLKELARGITKKLFR